MRDRLSKKGGEKKKFGQPTDLFSLIH